jgi:hypothetical protein
LLVLADCVNGGVGLWEFDASGQWTVLGPIGDGRAIARDGDVITIAHAAALEMRPVSSPAGAADTVALNWSGSAPSAPIVAIDRSPNGSTAIVAADGEGQTYGVAAPDGTVSRLQGAPTWPFTPLVGWIDADRLLVLNQGTDNVSRVAVVNSSDHSTQTLNALIDVRWFAISGDRTTVAAARESGIYVGQVTAWLAGEHPAQILPLNRMQIVWDLALDRTGTHVAMLSGTEAADGAVVDIRELGYAKSRSGWELTCDAGVPFTRVLGQVWLG